MARPEPMNASPSHSKLKLSLSFSDPLYVAGNPITGKLEMTAFAEGSAGLGISLISVDLFAIQELTSRDHSATSTFLHLTRRFQGEGLPPSNAVHPYPLPDSPMLPEGYHGARRGTSTFLFKLPIPANSPSSISFGNKLANVKYMVRATTGVFWKGEKRLVVSAKEIDVVSAFDWESARNEPEGVTVGENGKIWMMGKVVGGVCVSGEPGCIELQVKNHSNKKNTSLQLTLTRHLILPTSEAPPIEISDTLTTLSFKGPEYIIPPGVEGIASLVFDVPRDARMVPGGVLGLKGSQLGEVEAIFEVRSILEIKMGMGFGNKDLRLEIPVPIVHPIALPDLVPPPAVLPYANPTPYSGSGTPPYAPHTPQSPYYPSQTPAQVQYPGYAGQLPVVENGQVYFPPPSAYPMQSNIPMQTQPPPPHSFPPPSGYAPNARTGTPLPPPPPPPAANKEETLMPMPMARPKSIIRQAAPTSIPISPNQQPSPSTTPLHSPRPHQSVDYLTTKNTTASLGNRGMTRSKSVEDLEHLVMEEEGKGQDDLDIPATPPAIERRHTDVISPPPVPSRPLEQRRNSDIGIVPATSAIPEPPTSNVPALSKPLWKERKEQAREHKRGHSSDPPSSTAVMPVVMRNIGGQDAEEKEVAADAVSTPKVTQRAIRTINRPEITAKNTLLGAPLSPSSGKETQLGSQTKKLSRDFLNSLSNISPPAKGEEEKSIEELLQEQDLSSPSGGLGGGLDALEQRLLEQVGTQRPQVVESRAIPTAMMRKTSVKKQPSAVFEDEEPETELEPKTPRSAPVPILKPKQESWSPGGLEADSAVSSLTLGSGLGGSSPGRTPPVLSSSPLRKSPKGQATPDGKNQDRRLSEEKRAFDGTSSPTDDDHIHGHRGKKKMAVSSNRVEAWFKGLDAEAPDPSVELVGKSREKRDRQRKEREKALTQGPEKENVEEKSGEDTPRNNPPNDDAPKDNTRSSGFISFAAHAANTVKVTRSIIRSSPNVVLPPPSPTHNGQEVPASRKVDVPSGGMTFQRIRAAFGTGAEEERRLAGMGGLMGIWAGANPQLAKPQEEPKERPIKYAWDAEAEAFVAKNPWEEVLKARRDADTKKDAEGPGYDIRSARGGRGGKVTAVREIWNTTPSSSTMPAKSNSADTTTSVASNKEDRRRSAPSPPKSTSVPALLSSSTADAVLSSTASLARPVLRNNHRATKSLGVAPSPPSSPPGGGLRNKLTSIAEVVGRQPPSSPSTPKANGEMALGQARLKDLIKKYQGTGAS